MSLKSERAQILVDYIDQYLRTGLWPRKKPRWRNRDILRLASTLMDTKYTLSQLGHAKYQLQELINKEEPKWPVS